MMSTIDFLSKMEVVLLNRLQQLPLQDKANFDRMTLMVALDIDADDDNDEDVIVKMVKVIVVELVDHIDSN